MRQMARVTFLFVTLSALFAFAEGRAPEESVMGDGSIKAFERSVYVNVQNCVDNMEMAEWDHTCEIKAFERNGTEILTSADRYQESSQACHVAISATLHGYRVVVRGAANAITRNQAAGCLKEAMKRNGLFEKPISSKVIKYSH